MAWAGQKPPEANLLEAQTKTQSLDWTRRPAGEHWADVETLYRMTLNVRGALAAAVLGMKISRRANKVDRRNLI